MDLPSAYRAALIGGANGHGRLSRRYPELFQGVRSQLASVPRKPRRTVIVPKGVDFAQCARALLLSLAEMPGEAPVMPFVIDLRQIYDEEPAHRLIAGAVSAALTAENSRRAGRRGQWTVGEQIAWAVGRLSPHEKTCRDAMLTIPPEMEAAVREQLEIPHRICVITFENCQRPAYAARSIADFLLGYPPQQLLLLTTEDAEMVWSSLLM